MGTSAFVDSISFNWTPVWPSNTTVLYHTVVGPVLNRTIVGPVLYRTVVSSVLHRTIVSPDLLCTLVSPVLNCAIVGSVLPQREKAADFCTHGRVNLPITYIAAQRSAGS